MACISCNGWPGLGQQRLAIYFQRQKKKTKAQGLNIVLLNYCFCKDTVCCQGEICDHKNNFFCIENSVLSGFIQNQFLYTDFLEVTVFIYNGNSFSYAC